MPPYPCLWRLQEPNYPKCFGQDCVEWAWVSRQFALREFIEGHCPTMTAHAAEFEGIPLLPYPVF